MTIATTKNITLEEFLQLADIDESPAWEYIDSEAVQKPMGGGKHSTLQKRLIAAIDQASETYEAFPELRCTVGGRSVVPDITIVMRSQMPVDENGDIISTGITFAPAWVIEILSPNQSQTKVTGNILHCLRQGSLLGWLIDPSERSILVYPRTGLPELLSTTGLVPVLPEINLSLTVDEVFNWLRRR